MNFKRLLSVFIIFFVYESCNENKITKEESRLDKKQELDSLNTKQAIAVFNRNNAIIEWDKRNIYSYQLQELTLNNRISFIGRIKDIIKKKNFFVMKVYYTKATYDNRYLAEINIDSIQFRRIETAFQKKLFYLEAGFVFTVDKIQSMYPRLTSEIEYYDEENDEGTSYLTYDFSKTLICFKGNLVDFYIFKQLPLNE